MAKVKRIAWKDSNHKGVEKIIIQIGNMRLLTTSLGAQILSMTVPGKTGVAEEVTLHCYSPDTRMTPSDLVAKNEPYFGVTAGRYANRLQNGLFTLDGKPYELYQNNGSNTLHGGKIGFDKRVWNVDILGENGSDNDEDFNMVLALSKAESALGVCFSRISPNGEEGFPGNLECSVKHILTSNGELHMLYRAQTDKATVVNLTNHTYWNLSGNLKRDITKHEVQLFCDEYIPVSKDQIPTGEIAAVDGSNFDLRKKFHELGPLLTRVDGGGKPGYDHTFVSRGDGKTLQRVASVREKESGRKMDIETNQVGVQLYTANFLPTVRSEKPLTQHNAVCFETQAFPNSPNQEEFPSTILRPGATYFHHTRHIFSVDS